MLWRLLFFSCSILVFINCDSVASYLKNCVGVDGQKELDECSVHVKLFRTHESTIKDYKLAADRYKFFTELIEKNKKCLGELKCKEAKTLKEKVMFYSDSMDLMFHDFHKCLPKFYEAVYYQKNECVKKNAFMEEDLIKKRKAFTEGKACFVDFVKKECAPEAATFLNNYDRFLNLLTVKPSEDCNAPFFFLEQLQCKFMISAREEKVRSWKTMEKVGKEESDEVVKMCKYIEDCSKNSCNLQMQAKQIKEECVLNSIAHTDFATCLKKMKTIAECFDNAYIAKLRFADSSVNKCPEFEEKKTCLKKLMERTCGGQVKDFDTAVLKFKESLHCPV